MFRFTIRDVLWLTVVVGLALGWGVDHFRLRRRITVIERYSWEYFMQLKGIVPHSNPPVPPP